MRKTSRLCSLLFLTACSKVEIPSDIAALIYSPTIEKAKETVKSLSATNDNVIKNSDGTEIGRETYQMEVVRSAFQSNYVYHRTDTYSGTRISYDEKYGSVLYLTRREINLSYNAEESIYVASIKLTGSPSLEAESQIKSYSFRYTQSQMETEIDTPIFYANEVSGRYQGGYYLADFFKGILSELDSMKAVDNTLVYSFTDKLYKYGSESALVSETLIMNDFGMLKEMRQHAVNQNSGDVSDSKTVVQYNF